MFKKFQAGFDFAAKVKQGKPISKAKQAVKTIVSPIKDAAKKIKSTFTKAEKPTVRKIGGQEKTKKIKEAIGIKKKVEKLEKQSEAQIKEGKTMLSRTDMVEPTKNLRNIKRTKRAADKFVKETLKQDFKKGGRAGFKFGERVEKKNGKKGDLGMQSIIHGIDKNPKITAADPKAKFIAASKNKKKFGRGK
tara:strand:- start:54 stop:626 length:573 start_codon:yes stop_codon:yes gene_type:complete